MAKQRGVVQLSGRVDNLCYYQQKRVRGGLVRRINLAMSERVKSGEEYAPLRRYNAFFGACSMVASALISLINQRNLFMTRSDRQSYLTNQIKRILTEAGYNRYEDVLEITSSFAEKFPRAFNKILKVNARDFFISLPLTFNDVPSGATIVLELPAIELHRYCEYFNGAAVIINWYYDCRVGSLVKEGETGKYTEPLSKSTIDRSPILWEDETGDVELHISAGLNTGDFACVILRFDVVAQFYGDRRILSNSSSTAHMIGINW